MTGEITPGLVAELAAALEMKAEAVRVALSRARFAIKLTR